MKMKEARRFKLALALGLSLVVIILAIPKNGLAQPVGAGRNDEWYPAVALTGRPPLPSTSAASTTPLIPPSTRGIMSISGSTVMTDDCYEPDATKLLCFTVHNASTDAEWLDMVRLTFPPGPPAWTVSCNSQDTTDSSGSPVSLDCSASSNKVLYTDNDGDGVGEVTAGSSWGFCLDVTVPSGYNGPRIINWGLSGDDGGVPPHDVEGSTTVEMCTSLMLRPGSLMAEGCNGITQTHTFELWNNTGSDGTFDMAYAVPSDNATFAGTSSFFVSAGEIVTFTVQLKPDVYLLPGNQITAILQASGNSSSDTATIVKTVTDLSGWTNRTSSPIPAMDNVVAWAVHDGGLWSVGGYGAEGATRRYDPETNTWTTHATEMSPTISYPVDGCYGLDGDGHEVIVLFPDTIVTDTLHRYDITDDTWDALPVPVGFPGGRWAQDITSLYNVTGDNVCYISGGATTDGGGNVNNLWEYHPDTNVTIWLKNFTHHPAGFDFHASWYVPWVGSGGAICVGGGIDASSGVINDTQCYDLDKGEFNEPNADLGPLPEPWWGMADGWMTYRGRHQIWIANGVAQDGTLLPASAYADETTGGFVYGPELAVALYRLEGDGWMGNFYTEQGAAGGFDYSVHNQLLVQCPECNTLYLPLVVRN